MVVTENITYTAEFASDKHTVDVAAENGTVEGGGTYDYGTEITLTPKAAEHYHFAQWSDGNTDNPRTVVVTESAAYEAEFAIDRHSVVLSGENGTVVGAGEYDYGTSITLTATPDEDYYFNSWSDGNTDSPRTIELTQDTTLIADFVYLYAGQCGDNAYWRFSDGLLHVYGTGAMWNTTPWTRLRTDILSLYVETGITDIASYAWSNCPNLEIAVLGAGLETMGGYVFSNSERVFEIVCHATRVPTINGQTFSDISRNVPIYVPAESVRKYKAHTYWGLQNIQSIEDLPTYTITLTCDAGQGTVEGGGVYPEANLITLTATANAGYRFAQWSDGNTDNPRTLFVTSNKTLTALFSIPTGSENIVVDGDGNGNGSITPQKVFIDGQVYILRNGKTYTLTGVEVK